MEFILGGKEEKFEFYDIDSEESAIQFIQYPPSRYGLPGLALKYVPYDFQTRKVCEFAVGLNTRALQFVPISLLDENMYKSTRSYQHGDIHFIFYFWDLLSFPGIARVAKIVDPEGVLVYDWWNNGPLFWGQNKHKFYPNTYAKMQEAIQEATLWAKNGNGQSYESKTKHSNHASDAKPSQYTAYRECLGLSKEFTLDQLKQKYRELLQQWHPDKFQKPVDEAKENLKNAEESKNAAKIKLAQDELKEKQKDYDEALKETLDIGNAYRELSELLKKVAA